MTQLDLRDIQSLAHLRAALARFTSQVQEELRAADAEVRHTLEWMTDRVQHWQRETERVKRDVSQADSDLRRCLDSGFRDERGNYHPPNCSREAQTLARAEEYLRDVNIRPECTSDIHPKCATCLHP